MNAIRAIATIYALRKGKEEREGAKKLKKKKTWRRRI
jgi:hypothetical protein